MSERGQRIKAKMARRAAAAKAFQVAVEYNGALSVFHSSLVLPETVVILGSGANAVQGIGLIQPEHFIIAMNKSALLSPKVPDLFMCHARAPLKEEWWKQIMQIDCPRAFGYTTINKLEVLGKAYRYDYSFIHDPGWNFEPAKGECVYGLLRSGGTIAGAALQLCFWKGVKRVYFCGVDMFGNVYYDGSKADPRGKAERAWSDTLTLNAMIRYVREKRGIEVYTISDSKCCAERVDQIA